MRNKPLFVISKNNIPIAMIIIVMLLSFFSWTTTGAGVAEVGVFMLVLILIVHSINLDRTSILLLALFFSTLISSILGLFYGYELVIRILITYFISVVFICCALSYNYSEEQLKTMIDIYILSSAIGSLFILYNVAINHQYGYMRYSATFWGVDRDSLYLCAYQMGALYFVVNRVIYEKKSRIINAIMAVVIVIGQIFTGDRAAIVVSLFIVGYSIIVLSIKKKNIIKICLAMLIGILGLLVISKVATRYLPIYTFERLFTIESYQDNSTRVVMWTKCFNMFLEHPILGIGLDNNNISLVRSGLHYSHNVFLDMLCAQGLLGIAILGCFFLHMLKQSDDKTFTFGFIVSSMMTLFVVNGYNTMSFWVPILLITLQSKYNLR